VVLEGVEGQPAFSALPEVSHRGRCLACWAGKPVPARQLCETQQGPRVLQAAPAIHQHEDGDRSEPDGFHPDGEGDNPGHAHKAKDRGHHQAAGSSEYKPEQRAKNLAAIQGINWQDIEDQQVLVNEPDR
jgi:hypothetical protein